MMTAYDLWTARVLEAAGIDMILVGDSLANVMLGRETTRDIGMNEMLLFTAAVANGAPQSHIVADMPWKSDHSPEEAVQNARKLVEAGAHSVKIEGPAFEVIDAVVQNVTPVVAHLGLTPQTAQSFRQQGRTPDAARRIREEALGVEKAGAYALVLEHVPADLAAQITSELHIPVIGIGAGPDCDGQVLVFHDALGISPKIPPFAKKFTNLFDTAVQGVHDYISWVGNSEKDG